MPPVPTKVEPLEALRSRYPAALARVYEHEDTVRGGERPGEFAANCFDFGDGLRLIVSRERTLWGRVMLHVSASFTADSTIANDWRRQRRAGARLPAVRDQWAATVPVRWRELSG